MKRICTCALVALLGLSTPLLTLQSAMADDASQNSQNCNSQSGQNALDSSSCGISPEFLALGALGAAALVAAIVVATQKHNQSHYSQVSP